MPSRIAFCITTLDTGGAERQLVELVTRLPRDRFEPAVVVLSTPPQSPHDELVRQLDQHSVPVTFLGGRRLGQTPIVYRRLARWLHDTRPDLLQCFLAHANVLGAWAGSRQGIPIVTGIRVAEQRPNGHRLLQRWTAPLVERHVCVSQSVADFAEYSMQLPRERLVVIPNGVDVARFANVDPISLPELGVSPNRRLILYVGRLAADKRPDWLLDRWPAIAQRLPDHDLVIVGRGTLEDQLRQQATRLGLANRIHFAGWRPDVPRILVAAELVVLTSASEGMPNVILEAMAAARPVVATAAHGVAELLGDTATEQMTPLVDAMGFETAVVRIASDANLAAELGVGNRQRANRLFTPETTASSYADLYASLLRAAEPKNPAFTR